MLRSKIYLNGTLVSPDQARISPFDRGLLFGDGLFETVRIYAGRPHLLARHLRRLAAAARLLAIPAPPEKDLATAVEQTIEANAARDAVLRLTLTRGVGDGIFETDRASEPTVVIAIRPLPQNNADGMGEQLITLRSCHMMPEIGVRVKSLSYLTAIYSARELAAAGVREGILLTANGIVAGGTVSNLFCVANDTLHTPPLSLGVLDGITRGRVLELAVMAGIRVREEPFTRRFLLRAHECFYTNSVRELVPVTHIDGNVIGKGEMGEMTRRLVGAYRGETGREG